MNVNVTLKGLTVTSPDKHKVQIEQLKLDIEANVQELAEVFVKLQNGSLGAVLPTIDLSSFSQNPEPEISSAEFEANGQGFFVGQNVYGKEGFIAEIKDFFWDKNHLLATVKIVNGNAKFHDGDMVIKDLQDLAVDISDEAILAKPA